MTLCVYLRPDAIVDLVVHRGKAPNADPVGGVDCSEDAVDRITTIPTTATFSEKREPFQKFALVVVVVSRSMK
jgi:hypothetical protein